jgi:dTDP-4-dehydrorhamnose reductase
LDLTDRVSVETALRSHLWDVAVNTAAYTAVDRAESEPEAAMAVNRDGPRFLAETCARLGKPLIHISTDYVFDGAKETPYLEDDPVAPLGVYGRSKAAGEEEIRARLGEHVILRTAWLYGVDGRNFVKTMLEIGRERETIRVVNDQFGCPTYAGDLATAVLTAARKITAEHAGVWGTYHFCGGGRAAWYDFAVRIFELAGKYERFKVREIVPITTAEFPTATRRPKFSVLDCGRFENVFGFRPPDWEDGLARMIEDYLTGRAK